MICFSCGYSHEESIRPRGSMAYRDEMPKIKTTKECISEAIAARDKWWVTELHSKCPHKKIGEKRSCNACMYIIKQQLKKGVNGSSG